MQLTQQSGKRKFRPPLQRRSRAAWQRILEAGMGILVEQGRDALTIQAVCARAKVSPPTIYARVEGLSGLFWVIHDSGFAKVAATYDALLREAHALPQGTEDRIKAVVSAMCETFRRHATFLHQVINISTTDQALRERGSRESLAFIEKVTELLPQSPRGAAADVARMVQQECIFRALYGDCWLSRTPESASTFTARVTAMALPRFGLLRVSTRR